MDGEPAATGVTSIEDVERGRPAGVADRVRQVAGLPDRGRNGADLTIGHAEKQDGVGEVLGGEIATEQDRRGGVRRHRGSGDRPAEASGSDDCERQGRFARVVHRPFQFSADTGRIN